MSRLIKPARITLETLPDLFAYNKTRFGGFRMEATNPDPNPNQDPDPNAGPARPEGVSEEEWAALGDPGKAAIVRERERAQKAERELAAARARPAPPKNTPPKITTLPKPTQDAATGDEDPDDVAALVQAAVAEALKPVLEREQQREAAAAQARVTEAITTAAKPLLIDPSDAVAHIDTAQVTDTNGAIDTAKLAAALEALLSAKPHLGIPGRRVAPAGIGAGGGQAGTEEAEVKAAFELMKKSSGVRTTPAA